MTDLYIPSNGTEGAAWFQSWCSHCARDVHLNSGKDFDACEPHEVCQIIADSFIGPVKEWVYDGEGNPMCAAFVPVEQKALVRCQNTVDMFGEAKK